VKHKFLFLITKGDNIGGAQIYVKELAIQLSNDGHEVIVAMGTNGELNHQLLHHNITTKIVKNLETSIHPWKDVKVIFELKRLIAEVKPDLVCINSSKSGIVGRIACYLAKTKNVFVVHGWSYTNGLPFLKIVAFKLIEKILRKYSGYWICVSEFDFELGKKSKTIYPEKTKVIKNGISDKKIKTQSFNESDLTKIIFIARHDHQKDHRTLFEAIKDIEGIELLLLGDGPLLEKNQHFAKQLNIESKVQFLGFQSSVDAYLSESQIFVLVSNWEGFPISTLEAMSAGLPIIVTDVGGAGEAITNGVEGFVIKKGDSQSLKEKIEYLQKNKEVRQNMGKAARATYEAHYTFNHMYQKTLHYFQTIINN